MIDPKVFNFDKEGWIGYLLALVGGPPNVFNFDKGGWIGYLLALVGGPPERVYCLERELETGSILAEAAHIVKKSLQRRMAYIFKPQRRMVQFFRA